jgi:hypothetical protein
MAYRITWRSRPRPDNGFYAGAAATTAAAQDDLHNIGPFTEAQLTELFWRVRKIKIDATIGWTTDADPPETGTDSFSVVLRRCEDNFGLDEITDESVLFSTNLSGASVLFASDAEITDSGGELQFRGKIGRDESGKFWLIRGDEPAIIFASGMESHVSSYESEIAAGDMEVSGAVMELSGGVEIPIYLVAHAYPVGLGRPRSVTSATCTVAVEEWFPYKTTTGAAAWNTTTGAAANGGPAA